MPPPPESGDPAATLEECLRLLDAVPAAASISPAFRRHWPSISASLATLSAALSSPAFPPSAPLLAPLAAALGSLLSVAADAADAPRLGHLHTVSLLSTSSASLSQLAADARLLASPPPPPSSSSTSAAGADSSPDALVSRLRLGSAASRAAALEELSATASSLPSSGAAAAVSAVAALLDCPGADLLPATRERAVAVLAAFASSDAARRFLVEDSISAAVVPHLCRALESGGSDAAEHACLALLPQTATSRDAAAAVAARGGVAALLAACAGGTPATQAAAAGVLRNMAAFPDLLQWFIEEPGAVPLLLQLVSLGTPRAQELALGCLRNLTAGDGDHSQRLKVEAFQEGALPVVKDYLDGVSTRGGGGDEPGGVAPALGFLRNMASFRYIAEIASGSFAAHVAAALASDRSATRTEAALALAELCGNTSGKAGRKEVEEETVAGRLVWMMDSAKAAEEREAAARALAAVMAASAASRKAFRKDERGVAAAVRMLDPSAGGRGGGERRYAVAVLLAVAQSRRCRKQMVAAGACGFVQGLVAEEVEGAKKLAECLGKGKMLGVFPRT
ncbi:unnamed protein product [Urochloa humidicola]